MTKECLFLIADEEKSDLLEVIAAKETQIKQLQLQIEEGEKNKQGEILRMRMEVGKGKDPQIYKYRGWSDFKQVEILRLRMGWVKGRIHK